MSYQVCVKEDVDIDKLISKLNKNTEIVNCLNQNLTYGEYALVNYILNEGLNDIKGQEVDTMPLPSAPEISI